MKITLTDGTELAPVSVAGARRNVQGVARDTLTFVFPGNESVEALDALFTAGNCESIAIESDDGSVHVHNCYTVRSELSKVSVMVTPETGETEAVYEDRITISMAQRTYAESHLVSVTEAVDALIMESLLG